MSGGEDWRTVNRAHWDELVGIHLTPGSGYDLGPLRAGRGRLGAIEEAELGPVAGLRVLHLQCHFGQDTLAPASAGSPRPSGAACGSASSSPSGARRAGCRISPAGPWVGRISRSPAAGSCGCGSRI